MNTRSFSRFVSTAALALIVATPSFAAHKAGHKEKAAKVTELKIDTKKSIAKWEGKKVAGKHNGTVKIKEGSFTVENKLITAGEILIDLNSIENEDLKDKTWNEKLVGHLKSEDFFDVAKSPVAVFKIEKTEAIADAKKGEPNFKLLGDLTIRGKTEKLEVPALLDISKRKLEGTANFKIDRTKFGLVYNSAKSESSSKGTTLEEVAKKLGDKAIEDEFTVDVKIVAKK